jgi:hypothetical protein
VLEYGVRQQDAKDSWWFRHHSAGVILGDSVGGPRGALYVCIKAIVTTKRSNQVLYYVHAAHVTNFMYAITLFDQEDPSISVAVRT